MRIVIEEMSSPHTPKRDLRFPKKDPIWSQTTASGDPQWTGQEELALGEAMKKVGVRKTHRIRKNYEFTCDWDDVKAQFDKIMSKRHKSYKLAERTSSAIGNRGRSLTVFTELVKEKKKELAAENSNKAVEKSGGG